MFDPKDIGWIANAIPIEGAAVDVAFMVNDRFYIGDPNNAEQIADSRHYTPLTPLVAGRMFPIADVAGREDDLVLYYRRLIELAMEHGQSFDQFGHYFWMHLALCWRGGQTSLPWYDTWSQMAFLLDWLETATGDEPWYDVDQGWEMLVLRQGPFFFIREGDGDGHETLNIRMERQPLLRSIATTRQQTLAIISILRDRLGADVWTARTYAEKPVFGSEDWTPRRTSTS